MIAAYHRRLTSNDPIVRLDAARAWSIWEATTLSLHSDLDRVAALRSPCSTALAFARIESHYFVNNGFSRRDQVRE